MHLVTALTSSPSGTGSAVVGVVGIVSCWSADANEEVGEIEGIESGVSTVGAPKISERVDWYSEDVERFRSLMISAEDFCFAFALILSSWRKGVRIKSNMNVITRATNKQEMVELTTLLFCCYSPKITR